MADVAVPVVAGSVLAPRAAELGGVGHEEVGHVPAEDLVRAPPVEPGSALVPHHHPVVGIGGDHGVVDVGGQLRRHLLHRRPDPQGDLARRPALPSDGHAVDHGVEVETVDATQREELIARVVPCQDGLGAAVGRRRGARGDELEDRMAEDVDTGWQAHEGPHRRIGVGKAVVDVDQHRAVGVIGQHTEPGLGLLGPLTGGDTVPSLGAIGLCHSHLHGRGDRSHHRGDEVGPPGLRSGAVQPR